MSTRHNILEHFPVTLAKKVKALSKDKGGSALAFIKQALTKACANEQEQKDRFIQDAIKIHEETMAEDAAGELETFHSDEELLLRLREIRKAAERRRCAK